MRGKEWESAPDGYVLGWVLIVMLTMSILGLAALSIAADYHQKVLMENWDNQAYYTARSVLELAAAQMTGESSDNSLADAVREQIAMGNTEFDLEVKGMNSVMGTCTLNVIYREPAKELVFTAYADCNGKTAAMSVKMAGDLSDEERPMKILFYGDERLRKE